MGKGMDFILAFLMLSLGVIVYVVFFGPSKQDLLLMTPTEKLQTLKVNDLDKDIIKELHSLSEFTDPSLTLMEQIEVYWKNDQSEAATFLSNFIFQDVLPQETQMTIVLGRETFILTADGIRLSCIEGWFCRDGDTWGYHHEDCSFTDTLSCECRDDECTNKCWIRSLQGESVQAGQMAEISIDYVSKGSHALSISFGDGSSSSKSVEGEGTVILSHAYHSAGAYALAADIACDDVIDGDNSAAGQIHITPSASGPDDDQPPPGIINITGFLNPDSGPITFLAHIDEGPFDYLEFQIHAPGWRDSTTWIGLGRSASSFSWESAPWSGEARVRARAVSGSRVGGWFEAGPFDVINEDQIQNQTENQTHLTCSGVYPSYCIEAQGPGTDECRTDVDCLDGSSTCIDNDNLNYWLSSSASWDYPGQGDCTETDYCQGGTLYEARCTGQYVCPDFTTYSCPGSCTDGACVNNTLPPVVTDIGGYTNPDEGTITFTATASDPEGDPIQRVEFQVNTGIWQAIGSDTTQPWSVSWDSMPFSGSALVRARAFTIAEGYGAYHQEGPFTITNTPLSPFEITDIGGYTIPDSGTIVFQAYVDEDHRTQTDGITFWIFAFGWNGQTTWYQLGVDSSEPWTASWNSGNWSGNASIRAKAEAGSEETAYYIEGPFSVLN
ncbi:MAG: Ig-like domain-containing protein [Nanoarchaeota archaeon]